MSPIISSRKFAGPCERTAMAALPRPVMLFPLAGVLVTLCFICICVIFFFPSSAPAQDAGGPPTDVLRMELDEARARVTALDNAKGVPTEDQRAALAEARRKYTLIQERNVSLFSRDERGGFIAYAYNQQIGQEHLRLAEHYYSVFRQLFPEFRFTQRNPIHFIIYPNQAAYLKFEDIPQWAGGHAMTRRIMMLKLGYSDKGYTIEQDPRHKLLRLAINSDRDVASRSNFLGHEITHIFVWDLLNTDDKEFTTVYGNRFLNEGVAEYIGLYNLAALQNERLAILVQTKDPTGPFVWLSLDGYPNTGDKIHEYYSEAYLFVRWLATVDKKGGERLKAVLPAQNLEEFKKRLAEFERNEPFYKINLNDYPAYRKRILDAVPIR